MTRQDIVIPPLEGWPAAEAEVDHFNVYATAGVAVLRFVIRLDLTPWLGRSMLMLANGRPPKRHWLEASIYASLRQDGAVASITFSGVSLSDRYGGPYVAARCSRVRDVIGLPGAAVAHLKYWLWQEPPLVLLSRIGTAALASLAERQEILRAQAEALEAKGYVSAVFYRQSLDNTEGQLETVTRAVEALVARAEGRA